MTSYRFNRRGDVIVERRKPHPVTLSAQYKTGDPLFVPRRSSPARTEWKRGRAARRTKQAT